MTEYSRRLKLAEIPDGESNHTIEANAAECAAIADRLGIEAVLTLSAEMVVVRPDGPIIQIKGRISAGIRQICVVTLEPFESELSEEFTASFTTETVSDDEEPEVVVDAVLDDEPEPVVGGRIDLGELVVQYLSLALDSFPRRPDLTAEELDIDGVETDVEARSDDQPNRGNPFAVLEHMKRRP